jgi:hypothetical protein
MLDAIGGDQYAVSELDRAYGKPGGDRWPPQTPNSLSLLKFR